MFKYIADLVTYDLLRMEPLSALGASVHFFILTYPGGSSVLNKKVRT
jgi:hypothetical protein